MFTELSATKNCPVVVVTHISPWHADYCRKEYFYYRKNIVNIVKTKQFTNQIGWK